MKIKFAVIFFCLLSLVSCEQIVDNYVDQKIRDSYTSPYAGTYAGTYTGQDSGTLKIEISKKDQVTVTKHSERFNSDETFYGIMNGASFSNVVSQSSGFYLTGGLVSQNTTYSGTWSQKDISGTWQIQKK